MTMKLYDELDLVVEAFAAHKDRIRAYSGELKAKGGYKKFDVRLANDCLRAFMGTKYMCELYDKYNCDDSHITTLGKKALQVIGLL